MFANEVKIMRKLQHPNIVDFYGSGSFEEKEDTRPQLFLVSELMGGGSLKDKVCAVPSRDRARGPGLGRPGGTPARLTPALLSPLGRSS